MKQIFTSTAYFLSIILLQTMGFSQVKVETLVEQINASGGVKLHDNYLYVANFGRALDNADGREVYKISKSGVVQQFATGLSGASGNDFDSEGNLFQSNIAGNSVSKITASGQVSLFASENITCNVGIVVDPDDNLYVCNCCGAQGNTIRKVTPQGDVSLFASGNLFRCPNGITIDKDNNLYVSNFSNGNVVKISPSGQTSLLATTPGTQNSAASNGHIVYSPVEDVLYVASHGSHSIYRLTLDGVLTRIAGTTARGNLDGNGNEATFSRPNGLAITQGGDTMYVNSSIPVTDAGGRPLNPSKIRMLTGFYTPTSAVENELEQISINAHPNPTMDQLNIDLTLKEGRNLTLQLYDMLGNLILNKELRGIAGSNDFKINTDGLKQGSYALNLSSNGVSRTILIGKI